MLHKPFVVPITTGKLDISLLLQSSPSPPPPSSASTRPPPYSRSISVPSSTAPYPLIPSPSTSTTSHVSTATAPANPFSQQERRLQAPLITSGSLTLSQTTTSKRPPPDSPHPSSSPAKKQSKWTPNEDALIISLRGSGMKWEDISKRLPGRSAISCRLHYQNYLERKSEWDDEKKNKLARLYDRMKPDIWTPVARELGIPWRAVEAMHWHLGEQEMARRAGVTPFAMAAASGPSPSSAVGPSSSVTGLSSGGASLPSQGGSGSRLGMEGTRSRSESDSGGEPRRRRRREGGVHGGTMLPSLAEMEGGAPVYDEDEEEDEGAGS